MAYPKNCPKCGRPMHSFWCLHCGYMVNGKVITKESKNPNASDLEIYLGDRFDTVCYNENKLFVFLTGPFYFCFNRFNLLGICAAIGDFLLYALAYYFGGINFKLLVLFILMRIIYVTVANMVYMKVLSKRIEKIKKENPDNYLGILRDANGKTVSLLDLVVSALILAVIFFVAFIILRRDIFM